MKVEFVEEVRICRELRRGMLGELYSGSLEYRLEQCSLRAEIVMHEAVVHSRRRRDLAY